MKNWDMIGTYLERTVRATIMSLGDDSSFSDDKSLLNSIALIYIESIHCDVKVNRLIESLVIQAPLAIVLAGEAADETFDYLLNILDRYPTEKHVMTKLCTQIDLSEILMDFLSATWPSEDRFDEWRDYSLIVIGANETNYTRVIGGLKELIDT